MLWHGDVKMVMTITMKMVMVVVMRVVAVEMVDSWATVLTFL